MAARKKAAKKAPATEPAAPRWKPAADTAPAAGSRGPYELTEGKTQRLRAARLCPGGNSLDAFGKNGDGCGRCPSVAECTVARYNPKA